MNTSVLKGHIQCPVCGNTASFLAVKDLYNLYRCSGCTVVFISPMPTLEYLKTEVYSASSGYQGGKKDDLSNEQPKAWWHTLVKKLRVHGSGVSILDIGCSTGHFLFYMKKQGFVVSGIELNPRTASIAQKNGIPVFVGTLQDAKLSQEVFDIVFLGDVIEHVTDPRVFVTQCSKVLVPGGMIVISTPNLDCFFARSGLRLYQWFGIPWSSVTPPHHTFQFSDSSLDYLMNEQGYDFISGWYRDRPTLQYELGSTHLLGIWKREKTVKNFLKLVFGYSVYILLYIVDTVLLLFPVKGFSKVALYRKR